MAFEFGFLWGFVGSICALFIFLYFSEFLRLFVTVEGTSTGDSIVVLDTIHKSNVDSFVLSDIETRLPLEF